MLLEVQVKWYLLAFISGKRTTFRLLQEKTDSLVFGWNRFDEKGISKLILEREVDWAFDDTLDLPLVNQSEFNVIGQSCIPENYHIIAKTSGYFGHYEEARRSLIYERESPKAAIIEEEEIVPASTATLLAQQGVDSFSPQYLEGNAQRGKRTTFRLLQEKTDSLVFGWNRFDEKGISKLILEREVDWAFDDTLDLPLVNQSEFNVIGQSCIPENYHIIAKTSGYFGHYEEARRSLIYERATLLAQQGVDSFSPQYLEGNAQRGKRTTFRLLQEKTDSLVFGWNRFDEKGISKLILEREVDWAFDDTLDLPLVNQSEFNVIGQSCIPENYHIIAKTSGYFGHYEEARRSLIYERGKRTTFRLLQEKTDSLVFGWNRFDEKGISKLILEREVDWAFDDTLDLPLVNQSEFNVIGQSCIPENYHIIAKTSGYFGHYEEARRSLIYERESPKAAIIEEEEIVPASSATLLAQQGVDSFSPQYLEGNAQRGKRTTFRLLQEKTDSLVFGWNRFDEKGISKLILEREVDWAFDDTLDLPLVNQSEFNVIGQSCIPENYHIIAKTSGYFGHYEEARRSLIYERVPRVAKVEFEPLSNRNQLVKWTLEGSPCHPSDSVIIFEGQADESLEMTIVPIESAVPTKIRNSKDVVIILAVLHEERFSLPTLGN
ncbi:unnamed protein product [Trichobilharzia szidati]|nr:unnamed protein product [Trichobilharzia szidati]